MDAKRAVEVLDWMESECVKCGARRDVAEVFGVAQALVREIAFINDDASVPSPDALPIKEQLEVREKYRWREVREWVRSHTLADEVAA